MFFLLAICIGITKSTMRNLSEDDIKKDLMLRGFYQIHPTSVEEFLSMIEPELKGENELISLHVKFCKKYGPPKLGTSRATYIGKNFVFKLPITMKGYGDNDNEGSIVSIGKEGDDFYVPIARSKLLPRVDIPIVVMEKIIEITRDEIVDRFDKIPDFFSIVDSGQVGYNRKGRLVAFDYADL